MAAVLRWTVGASLLAFALLTEDWSSTAWTAIALLFLGLPLLLQLSPWPMLRAYALWLGLFVAGQSMLTHTLRNDLVTLTPHMQRVVDVRTAQIPGYPPGKRRVSTDERGYRVTPPLRYQGQEGTRIFAIGGSTTADIPLDDQSTWTHRLQQALATADPPLRVVNTGVAGLRAANHVATLQAVADLRPDLVLVLLGANDWNKHIKDHFEPRREPWRPPAFRYSLLGKAIDGQLISPIRRLLTGRSWADVTLVVDSPTALTQDGWKLGLDRATRHSFRPAQVAQHYAADLLRLGRLCSERKLRCLFLTQPHVYQPGLAPALRDLLWMTPPYADYTLDLDSMTHIASVYNRQLADFAAQGGHGLCDLASQMQPEHRFFYDDIHFTDDGAQKVAELVAPCVQRMLQGR